MKPSAPKQVSPAHMDQPAADRQAWDQWTWAFVALGAVVRLVRYLLKFPLWGDELLLAENFLDRSYAELMQPLHNNQCAPLLFLGVELTAIKAVGFSEWSLRLFPAACSIGGVFLFRHLAGRLLQGLPLLLAVAIFAVSFHPIRLGAEVKPYASDLTVSLVLLTLAVEWLRKRDETRWLWALALLAPVAIGLSFPAVFVAGGISLGIAWQAWRAGWGARSALAALCLAIGGAFLLFAWLSFQGQFQDSGNYMRKYWANGFPPLGEPWKLVVWLGATHTGELFAYPYGGERCGSIFTTACCCVGAWVLGRQRQFALLGTFAGISGLALVAAALQSYPYGDNSRLVQYLAPPICLLAGAGAAALITLRSSEGAQRRTTMGAVLVLGLCGAGILMFDLVHPYKHRADQVHRGFAQWFWSSHQGAEVLCLPTDDERSFVTNVDRSAYRCLQRIYARSLENDTPQQPATSAGESPRPIRCIVYSTTGSERNELAFNAWLTQMQSRFDFVRQQRFTVQLKVPQRQNIGADYDVYEFARRPATNVALAPAEAPSSRLR